METSLEFRKIISNNDDEERDILEQFLLRLDLRYDDLNKTEKPDFILVVDNNRFGFEITKYYSDKNRKGSNSYKFLNDWITFINDLRNRINQLGEEFKYYYGAIFLNEEIKTFKKFDKELFLTELTSSLKNIKLERGEKRELKNNEFDSTYLTKTLEHIYLENAYPSKNPMWWLSSLQTGIVNIDYDKLNKIIEEKEKKAIKYNKDLNSKYLLIYAAGLGLNDILIINDGLNVSTVKRQGRIMVYELHKDQNKNILSSKNIEINTQVKYFDHIYTFDHFTETIWEIYPEIRQVFDYGKKTIWVNRRPMIKKENKNSK